LKTKNFLLGQLDAFGFSGFGGFQKSLDQGLVFLGYLLMLCFQSGIRSGFGFLDYWIT